VATSCRFAGKFVEPQRPGGWLDPGPYGCLGAGLGAAIAARLARPSAQITLLLGDGAAGFSLMDVDTLVRHNLPVVMVMGNNAAWGLEKGPMQMLYGYDVVADLSPLPRTTVSCGRWAAVARRSRIPSRSVRRWIGRTPPGCPIWSTSSPT
jgi:thiamine pyrophosphate-dependent acetolactate synthase large subunit-like protein